MHPTPAELTDTLLRLLRSEGQLLARARDSLAEVHAALRRGDLAAVEGLRAHQESLAASLHAAGAERAEGAARLAAELGLAADATLSALAECLPGPAASELRELRPRLAAAAAELGDLQRRNANLIGHLRSYFRDVLADLTAADAPVRYGPSGARLAAAGGTAVHASG